MALFCEYILKILGMILCIAWFICISVFIARVYYNSKKSQSSENHVEKVEHIVNTH